MTATFLLSTSSEFDDLTDCSGSDALLSLSSSMENEQTSSLGSGATVVNRKPIPLLRTHPATPTSPSPPRDWAIDEQSDRLFREFTRVQTISNVPSPALKKATSPVAAHRQNKGIRSPRKLKSYSPSSSHGGTPAQASIEETEEEQDISLSSTATGATVISVNHSNKNEPNNDSPRRQLGPILASESEQLRPETEKSVDLVLISSGSEGPKVQIEGEPTDSELPGFFICSTKEQVTNRMSQRSRSPQLRHVPIIKLPDQESAEV